MKCPACETELRMTDRQGVEIDYCPSCRGVWLDRGELDKLIERESPGATRPAGPPPAAPPYRYDDDSDDRMPRYAPPAGYPQGAPPPQQPYPYPYPPKRKSFWREILDFD